MTGVLLSKWEPVVQSERVETYVSGMQLDQRFVTVISFFNILT